MAGPRQVLDKLNDALLAKDIKTAAECYAEDAVVIAPDQGEIRGREHILEYHRPFVDAFSDMSFDFVAKHECGNVAIDETVVTGRNTGSLTLPSGEHLPATGKTMQVRECDVAVVEDGVITSHRFYWDQASFLEQLGLMPDMPS